MERILEESLDIRKQKTDHCKYKYIMLRNGIKVNMIEDILDIIGNSLVCRILE